MVGGKLYWLSASDNCQLWDDSLELIHKFSRGNVLDVAWDSEGTNIALASKNSNQIITCKFDGQSLEDVSVIPEGDVTALEFANDSLMVGTSVGSTLSWDYNKHKLLRKFSGVERTPVHCLQVNHSIIAAGHSNGVIQIYGVKTGIATGQCSIQNSGGIRDLKISTIKSSLMAAAFTSGTVAAWNTCSNKVNNTIVAEFNCAHQAPATSVALSPVTDILMVSGGLDRNIILYDFPKKKILKKIETEAPVTAVEFFPDGTSLLVGTSKGKVFLYDLRSISTPAKTIARHSSSVLRLLCRQQSRLQLRNNYANIKKSVVPAVSPIEDNLPRGSPLVSTVKNLDNDVSHFHSPLERIKNLKISSSTPGSGEANFKSNINDSACTTKDTEPRNSSLFSPLKGEATSDVCSSPSLATSPLLKFNPRKLEDSVKSPESFNPNTTNNLEDQQSPSSPTKMDIPSIPEQTCHSMKAEDSSPAQSTSVPAITGDFQTEFIRRIVREVEDNLREVLRCRFGDLIVQSAQQFLTLQNELEQLKAQVQEKVYLEEEVRRLRQEVNQLRKLH